MENSSLRRKAKEAGIPLWKIALSIGVSEPTLTRWLRVPLSDSKEHHFLEALSRLEGEVTR